MTNSEPQDTQHQNRSRVRASDAERERVADRLRGGVTDGRLTLEEGDERLAALYAMKFRDELPSLTHDLPGDPADEPQDGRWGGRGRAAGRGEDGERGPQWGGGPGSPWGGPGAWGGPGNWGGSGNWGGPRDGDGRPSGWNMRRPPWPFRVFPIVMLLIIVGIIVSAVGGHFFWPIIPLFFLFVAFSRFAVFRACRRGWTR